MQVLTKRNYKLMEKISVNELLKVMDMNTYRRLRYAGRLSMARVAPNAEVYVDSIPIRFRRRLDELHQNNKG